jgi:YVTN family beta-propeller protein
VEEQPKSPALTLGHNQQGVGLGVLPCAAGVAISNDGQTLVVANYYNDSITVFNGGYGNWSKVKELDLRPGKNDPAKVGTPGGEYPFWVVMKGTGSSGTVYVSSIRDREIVVVKLGGAPGLFGPVGLPAVASRIRVKGQPNKMTLNAAQSLLYVAEDQSDTVDVIDTATNTILETIPVIGAAALLPSSLAQYKGANPNSVTLSPDEKQLYVTNGNLNCISVVALSGTNSGDQVSGPHSVGLVPELRELQLVSDLNDLRQRCQIGVRVRGECEVADGRESWLLLWRLRAGGIEELYGDESV